METFKIQGDVYINKGWKTLENQKAEDKELPPLFGDSKGSSNQEPTIIGTCPICGSNVKATRKGFFCTNNDCRFALWPTMKYFNNEIKISEARAKALLTKGRALFSLKTKTGKPYKAYLKTVIKGKNEQSIRFFGCSFVDLQIILFLQL